MSNNNKGLHPFQIQEIKKGLKKDLNSFIQNNHSGTLTEGIQEGINKVNYHLDLVDGLITSDAMQRIINTSSVFEQYFNNEKGENSNDRFISGFDMSSKIYLGAIIGQPQPLRNFYPLNPSIPSLNT